MLHYVIVHKAGPGWDSNRAMREKDGPDDHAKFMNGLEDEHFVLQGGPSIISGVLRVVQQYSWEILLRELPRV